MEGNGVGMGQEEMREREIRSFVAVVGRESWREITNGGGNGDCSHFLCFGIQSIKPYMKMVIILIYIQFDSCPNS